MEENSKLVIWIDADACPKAIREIVYKASNRTQVKVFLVSNAYMQTPVSDLVKLIEVDQGADVADMYIVKNSSKGDLVITADIPLAADLVKKGIFVIDQRGEEFTKNNIDERLSLRNFMTEMRSGGLTTKGPQAYSSKDKTKFAATFDRVLNKALKNHSK